MAKLRTLWRVTQGFPGGQTDPTTEVRPESKRKVYEIYVPNNIANAQARTVTGDFGRRTYSFTEVWVDERDGHGWQLYERIEHTREDQT
jgi:hypothetical protein